MIVKLLTGHDLEFLSLKGGCTGSSESTLVKMPHCWKSHVMAQLYKINVRNYELHLPDGNPPPKNMLNNSSGDISPENR